VVELQAGLADGRVVHDLEEAGRVRHQSAIEQGLVRIEQVHQVDEPVEVGGLVLQLQQDAAQLHLGCRSGRGTGSDAEDVEIVDYH